MDHGLPSGRLNVFLRTTTILHTAPAASIAITPSDTPAAAPSVSGLVFPLAPWRAAPPGVSLGLAPTDSVAVGVCVADIEGVLLGVAPKVRVVDGVFEYERVIDAVGVLLGEVPRERVAFGVGVGVVDGVPIPERLAVTTDDGDRATNTAFIL